MKYPVTGTKEKPIDARGYRLATLALATALRPKIVVEVGVYAGALSKMLASLPCVEKYYIVDSWDGDYSGFGQQHMDVIAKGVIDWAATQPKVTVMRMDSAVASKSFEDESVDFFHTDGDHTPEGIRADIRNWLPKVALGGILSGDNYEADTVAGGVQELLPHHQVGAKGRLWWYRKSSSIQG